MTKSTHKKATTKSLNKKPVQDAFKAGFDKAEHLVQNATEVSAEIVEIGSHNVQALNKYKNVARNVIKDLGSEMATSYRNILSSFIEISGQALKCRTLSDLTDLQSTILQSSIKDYLDESTRLSKILLEGYSKAITPLQASATSSTVQLRKLLAA